MGIINILDKHTANLIAAGEVVERPASAVKELLENSADAGATRVTVEIKNGGTTYIRVTDNGCGMTQEDLKSCILRHATSKISKAEDLYSIGTYGFRGEALAAIAAVCNLKIMTKRAADELGHVLTCSGGTTAEVYESGCPDGTTIIASDIFANIPARRKFLKKDSSEGTAVLAVTEKFALSRPHIAVTLISDGNIKLRTDGDGNLKNAIYSCLGKEFATRLIELSYNFEGITISGFIGKPEACRPSRNMQNFFINGRYIKSGTICAALEEGFRAFCPVGKFPAAVIFCDIDPSRVDVNIHPAKTEVKFTEDKKVFDAVLFAVKTALGKGTSFEAQTSSPSSPPKSAFVVKNEGCFEEQKDISKELRDFFTHTQENKPEYPVKEPQVEKYNPIEDLKKAFSQDSAGVPGFATSNGGNLTFRATDPEKVLDIYTPAKAKESIPEVKVESEEEKQISFDIQTEEIKKVHFRVIGECFDSYIIVEKDGVLYLIDKHAAHERIIYEEIKHTAADKGSQIMLEPIKVSLSTDEYQAICDNADYFESTGFSIDTLGTGLVVVRSVPEHIPVSDVPDIMISLASKLLDGNGKAAADLFDRALFTAACKAAVKAGQKNSYFQDEYIANKIFSDEAVLYCPHGRPVIIEFTKDRLDRMFKRT